MDTTVVVLALAPVARSTQAPRPEPVCGPLVFGTDFVESPADVDLPADVVKPDSPFLVAKEKLRFIGSEDSELCS